MGSHENQHSKTYQKYTAVGITDTLPLPVSVVPVFTSPEELSPDELSPEELSPDEPSSFVAASSNTATTLDELLDSDVVHPVMKAKIAIAATVYCNLIVISRPHKLFVLSKKQRLII
ncbi:MAG: hypothetical protein COC17_07065 [Hyphomicrobiales bacterium]|nr:MAG: hypothetical protein COC17_07065 [Hyphomicrobiales bacterium]